MLPITKQLSKYNHSIGNNIEYIVIHDTGNSTDSAQSNANYFCECDRSASAHYFVDDSSIFQVVEDINSAWHCGDGHGAYGITNYNSIGIEQCRINNDVSSATENNTIELTKMLMARYSIPIEKIVRHYDASRKNCPSSFSSNNWNRWFNFKKRLAGSPKNERNGFNMFNESYYLQTYPDVAESVKEGKVTAKDHWENYGIKENRRAIPLLPNNYCEGVYISNNSDVAEAIKKGDFTCGAEHWLLYGWNENRKYSIGGI